jgi:hypothetical protein
MEWHPCHEKFVQDQIMRIFRQTCRRGSESITLQSHQCTYNKQIRVLVESLKTSHVGPKIADPKTWARRKFQDRAQ